MSNTPLENALNTVSQLPLEQQAMLVEIIQNRLIDARRQEIAQDAHISLAAFRAGHFLPQSAEAIITELRHSLDEDDE